MSNQKRIATDLDETLFDMMTPFKQILMKRHSARVVEDSGYNIKTYPEISDKEIWDIFKFQYDAHVMCEPFPGAKAYLERIYQLTRKPPVILTSRPDGYESQTHAQIRGLVGDMPYHLIISGTPAEKKYLYADEFDIMVDDRLETLMHLVEHFDKTCILIQRPWNKINDLPCPTDQWYFQKKIIQVNGVREITPFLPVLIG